LISQQNENCSLYSAIVWHCNILSRNRAGWSCHLIPVAFHVSAVGRCASFVWDTLGIHFCCISRLGSVRSLCHLVTDNTFECSVICWEVPVEGCSVLIQRQIFAMEIFCISRIILPIASSFGLSELNSIFSLTVFAECVSEPFVTFCSIVPRKTGSICVQALVLLSKWISFFRIQLEITWSLSWCELSDISSTRTWSAWCLLATWWLLSISGTTWLRSICTWSCRSSLSRSAMLSKRRIVEVPIISWPMLPRSFSLCLVHGCGLYPAVAARGFVMRFPFAAVVRRLLIAPM